MRVLSARTPLLSGYAKSQIVNPTTRATTMIQKITTVRGALPALTAASLAAEVRVLRHTLDGPKLESDAQGCTHRRAACDRWARGDVSLDARFGAPHSSAFAFDYFSSYTDPTHYTMANEAADPGVV